MAIEHQDQLRRYKVHFEAHKSTRPYTLEFYQKYRKGIDPSKSIKALWAKPTFPNVKEAVSHAENIIKDIQTEGTTLTALDQLTRTQILSLSVELTNLGYEPSNIIYEAIQIAKNGGDPLKSIEKGSNLFAKAKNYIDHSFKDMLDLYEHDPVESSNRTHARTIWALRTLDGLGDLPISILVDADLAIEKLTEVYTKYVSRPSVKRKESAKDTIARVNQLITYIHDKAKIPALDDLKTIKSSKKYSKLLKPLLAAKPNNTFYPAEILTLIKLLSREKTFEPSLPILSTFIGCRRELYRNLEWKFFDMVDHRDQWSVTIPNALTKLGRQHRSTEDITFKTSAIPCLPLWLDYLRDVWSKSKYKITPFVRHYHEQTLSDKLNSLINQYASMFHNTPKDGSNFTYGSIYTNAFRNTFFTLGLKHPIVELNCAKIGNDYQSHLRYTNTSVGDVKEEAEILFSLTPDMLHLVNLEEQTVDKEFLYADLATKKKMYSEEWRDGKRLIYEAIIESMAWLNLPNTTVDDFKVNPDSITFYEFDGWPLASHLLPNLYQNKLLFEEYYYVDGTRLYLNSSEDPLNLAGIAKWQRAEQQGDLVSFEELEASYGLKASQNPNDGD